MTEPRDHEWSGTERSDWTLPGVYFRTDGWRLRDASATRLSWEGMFGGTMTLSLTPGSIGVDGPCDLDQLRAAHRVRAAERRGGLVSADVVALANGEPASEIVTKYQYGPGYRFEGLLLVESDEASYRLEIDVAERETGSRESIVNSLRIQLGEIDMAALMAGPVNPATGGRPIPGMQLDPYDAAYDAQATYSASDDPRLDDILQTHPLAIVRSTLRRVQSTWEGPVRHKQFARRPASPSDGPRLVLSDRFFTHLRAIVDSARKSDS